MERVTAGWIMAATFELTRKHLLALALFSIALGALTTGFDSFDAGTGLRVGELIGGFVAGYFLLLHLIDCEGLLVVDKAGIRLLPFFGALILTSIGVLFGLLFFIIPGLILMARWSIAYSLVISDGLSMVDAMRESWDCTRSAQWSIVGAYAVFFLTIVAAIVSVSVMAGAIGGIVEVSDFDTVRMAKSEFTGLAGAFAINCLLQGMTGVGYVIAVAIQKGVRNTGKRIEMVFE